MEWPANNTYPEVKSWLEQFCNDNDPREKSAIVRQLLEWYTGKSRTILIAEPHRFSESDLNRLKAIGLELQKHKPVQYITGEAWFYGRRFMVTPDVLIPRPETEELMAYCLPHLSPGSKILDIGTGSGCIAITIALEAPMTEVFAWEVSPRALSVARKNAEALQATVHFEHRDALIDGATLPFDFIVSNPPYIAKSEAPQMDARVTQFEPGLALFVENDPLEFYDHIVSRFHQWLNPGGRFAFECHEAHAQAVLEICLTAGCEASIHRDAQGKPRMVTGLWAGRQ